jgi:hypothetical protein
LYQRACLASLHARMVINEHSRASRESVHHKVRIYKEYHSVCPLVRIGTPPTPLSPATVPLPPEPGGRHTRVRVRGWGSHNSDYRKSLALCLLCGVHSTAICKEEQQTNGSHALFILLISLNIHQTADGHIKLIKYFVFRATPHERSLRPLTNIL